MAGSERAMKSKRPQPTSNEPLRTLSVIIPVDDGSTDDTWKVLGAAISRVPTLKPVQNAGQHGFGRAVTLGFDRMSGDAAVIMMADESDDCRDVISYWR